MYICVCEHFVCVCACPVICEGRGVALVEPLNDDECLMIVIILIIVMCV